MVTPTVLCVAYRFLNTYIDIYIYIYISRRVSSIVHGLSFLYILESTKCDCRHDNRKSGSLSKISLLTLSFYAKATFGELIVVHMKEKMYYQSICFISKTNGWWVWVKFERKLKFFSFFLQDSRELLLITVKLTQYHLLHLNLTVYKHKVLWVHEKLTHWSFITFLLLSPCS